MLCPQGGHQGWEWVVEGQICYVCVSLWLSSDGTGDSKETLAWVRTNPSSPCFPPCRDLDKGCQIML